MDNDKSLEEEHEFLAAQKKELAKRMAINRAIRGVTSSASPLDALRLLGVEPHGAALSGSASIENRHLSLASHSLVEIGRILCGEKLSQRKTRADRTYREPVRRAVADFPQLLEADPTTNGNRKKYFLEAESLRKYALAKNIPETSIAWRTLFGAN